MSKKFYIADWHYGHKNVIAYDNRPFKSVEDMNEELIRRWNEAVSAGDLVYILGDMFWCKPADAIPVLNKLNGQKILVKGNHDMTGKHDFGNKFVKITDYLEVEDAGRKVVLSHYPIPFFKNHSYGWYHLYGHVHSSFEWNMVENLSSQISCLYDKPHQMYNVGAMMSWMDYTPRTLDEIIEGGQL